MTLRESCEVRRSYILNAPFVNDARRDVAGGYQVAQPLRGVWVNLVVVGGHGQTPSIGGVPLKYSKTLA